MMRNYYGLGGYWGGGNFFLILTWLLFVAFLILGIVYFWKEINNKKK